MAEYFQYNDPLEQLYFQFIMEHGPMFQPELSARINEGIKDSYEGRPAVVDNPLYLIGYNWATQYRPAQYQGDLLSNIAQPSMDNIVGFLDPQTAQNLALTNRQNRDSVRSAIERGFVPQQPLPPLQPPASRGDKSRLDDFDQPPPSGKGRPMIGGMFYKKRQFTDSKNMRGSY